MTTSSTKETEVDCNQTSISMEIKILLNLLRMVMLERNIIHYLCKQWNSSGINSDWTRLTIDLNFHR
nr:MAG TPA: hypothetical protein [Caudoviricetes sp.]